MKRTISSRARGQLICTISSRARIHFAGTTLATIGSGDGGFCAEARVAGAMVGAVKGVDFELHQILPLLCGDSGAPTHPACPVHRGLELSGLDHFHLARPSVHTRERRRIDPRRAPRAPWGRLHVTCARAPGQAPRERPDERRVLAERATRRRTGATGTRARGSLARSAQLAGRAARRQRQLPTRFVFQRRKVKRAKIPRQLIRSALPRKLR